MSGFFLFIEINTILTNTIYIMKRTAPKLMTKSFTLIEVDEDLRKVVKGAIERHPAVSGVYTVVDGGDEESMIYDIVVEVEADSRRDLDNAESEIRTRKDVRFTLTLEVIEKDDIAIRRKNKSLQI
jgi:hypothetical protein